MTTDTITKQLNCTCAKSNWDSLSCPMHGLDTRKHTQVACPHCSEQLDPAYLTNTVIIEGDTTKVCDTCFDNFDECGKCHLYHHTSENNKVYVSHDHGYAITCNECAGAAHDGYEAAMERKFDEMREEGRRYW